MSHITTTNVITVCIGQCNITKETCTKCKTEHLVGRTNDKANTAFGCTKCGNRIDPTPQGLSSLIIGG